MPPSAGQAPGGPPSPGPDGPTSSGVAGESDAAFSVVADAVNAARGDAGTWLTDSGAVVDEEEDAAEWIMFPGADRPAPGGVIPGSEASGLAGGWINDSGDRAGGAPSVAARVETGLGQASAADASQAPGGPDDRVATISAERSAASADPASLRPSRDQTSMMPMGALSMVEAPTPGPHQRTLETGLSGGADTFRTDPAGLTREPSVLPRPVSAARTNAAATARPVLPGGAGRETQDQAEASSGGAGQPGSADSRPTSPSSSGPLVAIAAGPQDPGPKIAAIRAATAPSRGLSGKGVGGSFPPQGAVKGAQSGQPQPNMGPESPPGPAHSWQGAVGTSMFGPASRAGWGPHDPDPGSRTDATETPRGASESVPAKGALGSPPGDRVPGRRDAAHDQQKHIARGTPNATPATDAARDPGQLRRVGRWSTAPVGTPGQQAAFAPGPGQPVEPVAEGGDQVELADRRADASLSEAAQAQVERGVSAARGQNPAATTAQASSFRQVAEAIAAAERARVEIRLEPEELGRIRFHMQITDHGIALQVTADRAETLEMMRRHVDQLARHLSDAGFPGSSFSFAGERQGRPGTPTPEAPPSNEAPPAERVATAAGDSSADPATRDGLDLRL